MTTIVTRAGKGSALTHTELDNNFTNLNTDKVEASGDSMTGNLSFGDNNKAIFGAGSDLQIYHDGSNSWVSDAGTGELKLSGNTVRITNAAGTETAAAFLENGACYFRYDDNIKLATTSTGIDVTGTVTADGLIVSDTVFLHDGTSSSSNAIEIGRNRTVNGAVFLDFTTDLSETDFNFRLNRGSGANGGLQLRNKGTGALRLYTNNTNRFQINGAGDISFYEDTGTTAKFFWDASAERLGIGTTPSRALHTKSGQAVVALLESTSTSTARLAFVDANTTDDTRIGIGSAGNDLQLLTNNTERLRIDSAGNVGIGTSSPTAALDVNGTVSATSFEIAGGQVFSTVGSFSFDIDSDDNQTSRSIFFTTNGGARNIFSILDTGRTRFYDESGNIGAEWTPVNGILQVDRVSTLAPTSEVGITAKAIMFDQAETSTAAYYPMIGQTSDGVSNNLGLGTTDNSGVIQFYTGNSGNGYFGNNANTERARIDSSGNLLVGKTSASVGTTGLQFIPDGVSAITRDDDTPLYLNRITSAGDILEFRKDNTTVGSIATVNGDMFLGTGNTALRFTDSAADIRPVDSTGDNLDATTNLGASATRFKDLYLSGGVYLGGTGADNLLSEFEVGTFVATLTDGTNTASITDCKYVKVGKQVTIFMTKYNQNTTGWSGDLTITGLPFASENRNQGGVLYVRTGQTAGTATSFRIANSTTTVELHVNEGSATSATKLQASTAFSMFSEFSYRAAT